MTARSSISIRNDAYRMTEKLQWRLIALLLLVTACGGGKRPHEPYAKGELLYSASFSSPQDVAGWQMEGPGELMFEDGWMTMYAKDQAWHHVFWCPQVFPSRFVAEWEVQNKHPEEGLLIVFFATTGLNGEDIFDSSLPARDGTFRHYTRENLKSYHVSYYANNPKNPDREFAHLRKNNLFALVQTGEEGVPKASEAVHKIRLVKDDEHIVFFVDDRKIIDWRDDGETYGQVYGAGRIGFRQMQWSRFSYRNFNVWALAPHEKK